MRRAKVAVCVGVAWGLVMVGCDQKSGEGGSGSQTSETSGQALSKPGPSEPVSTVIDDAAIEEHIGLMADAQGCEARPEGVWCELAAAWAKGPEEAELPTGTLESYVGLTQFVPTSGEGLERQTTPIPMAFGWNPTTEKVSLMRLVGPDGEQSEAMRAVGRQAQKLMERPGEQGARRVVVHDPDLFRFLHTGAGRAATDIEREGKGYRLDDATEARVIRVGGRWMVAHLSETILGRTPGMWLSVLEPVRFVDHVMPEEDIDLEGLRERLGCAERKPQTKVLCEGLGDFAGGSAITLESMPEQGYELYFGQIVGDGIEVSTSAGGAAMRRPNFPKWDSEVAFSEISATNDKQVLALRAMDEAIAAGEDPDPDNLAYRYLVGAAQLTKSWGELDLSQGRASAIAVRPRLFRELPSVRTTSYFRRGRQGRLLVLTHDHIGGRVWVWRLDRIPSPEELEGERSGE